MDCTQVLCSSDPDDKLGYKEGVKVAVLKVEDTEHAIFSGKNRIGRDPEFCRVILDSMALSKEHAIIETHSHDCHYIYDLGSKNRTKLDKKYLEPHIRYHLTDGALLQFGDVIGEYVIVDGHEKSDVSLISDSDESFIVDTPVPSRSRIVFSHSTVASHRGLHASTQCGCRVKDCKFCFPLDQQTTSEIMPPPLPTANPRHQDAGETEERKESGTLVSVSDRLSSGQGPEMEATVLDSSGDIEDDGDVTDPEDIFHDLTEKQIGEGESKLEVAASVGEKKDGHSDKSSTPSPSMLQEDSVEESVENIRLYAIKNDTDNVVDQNKCSLPESESGMSRAKGVDKVQDGDNKGQGTAELGGPVHSSRLDSKERIHDMPDTKSKEPCKNNEADGESEAFLKESPKNIKDTNDIKTKNGRICDVQSVLDSVKNSTDVKTTTMQEGSAASQSVAVDDDDATDDEIWDTIARKTENLENQPKLDKKMENKQTNYHTNVLKAVHEGKPKISEKLDSEKKDKEICNTPAQIEPVIIKLGENLKSIEKNDSEKYAVASKAPTQIFGTNTSEKHLESNTEMVAEEKNSLEPNEKNDGKNNSEIWDAPTQIIPASSHGGNEKKAGPEKEREDKVDEGIWDEPTQIIPVKTRSERIVDAKKNDKNDDGIQKVLPPIIPSSSHTDKKSESHSKVERETNADEEIWDMPTQIIVVKNRPGKTLEAKENDLKNGKERWESRQNETNIKIHSGSEKQQEIEEDIWDAPTQIISVRTRPGKNSDSLKESEKRTEEKIQASSPQITSGSVGNILEVHKENKDKNKNDSISDATMENIRVEGFPEEKSGSNARNETHVWKKPTSDTVHKTHSLSKDEKDIDNHDDDIWNMPTQVFCPKSPDEKPGPNVSEAVKNNEETDDEIWDAPTQIINPNPVIDTVSKICEKQESVIKQICSTPKSVEGNEASPLGNQSSDLEISFDNTSSSGTKEAIQAPEIEDVSDDSRTPSPSFLQPQEEPPSAAQRVLRLRLSTIDELSEKSGSSMQSEAKLSFSEEGRVSKLNSNVFNESTLATSKEEAENEKDVFEAPTQPVPLPLPLPGGSFRPVDKGNGEDDTDDELFDAPTQILPRKEAEENKLKEELKTGMTYEPVSSPEDISNVKEDSDSFESTEGLFTAPARIISPMSTEPCDNKSEEEMKEDKQDDDQKGEMQCLKADEDHEAAYESDASYGSINDAPTQAIDDLVTSNGAENPAPSNAVESCEKQGISVTGREPRRPVKTRERRTGGLPSKSSQESNESGCSENDRTKMIDAGKMLKSKKSVRERRSQTSKDVGQQSSELRSASRRRANAVLVLPSNQEMLQVLSPTSRKASDIEMTSPVISRKGKSRRTLGKDAERQDIAKKGRKCSDSIISSTGPDQSSHAEGDRTEVRQSTSLQKRHSKSSETPLRKSSDSTTVELNTSSDETRPRRHQKLTWKLKENLINDLEEIKRSSPVQENVRIGKSLAGRSSPATKRARTALSVAEPSTPKLSQRKRGTFERKQDVQDVSQATAPAKMEVVGKGLSRNNESDEDSVLSRRGNKPRTEKKAEKHQKINLSVSDTSKDSPTVGGKLNRRSKVGKEEVKPMNAEPIKKEEKKTEKKHVVASKERKSSSKKVDQTGIVESSPILVHNISSRKSRLKSGIKTAQTNVEAKNELNESVKETRPPSRRRKTDEILKPEDLDAGGPKKRRATVQSTTVDKATSPSVKETPSRQKRTQKPTVSEDDSGSERKGRGRALEGPRACTSPLLERVSSPKAGRKRKASAPLDSSETESQEGTPKRSSRLAPKQVHSIMFTGVCCSPADERAVKKLGGKIVEDPTKCTVLVTDKVRRTFKFLCMMAQGKPIVSMDWINKSQSIGQFADPWNFLVKDTDAEKKFKFSLGKSLKLSSSKKLLDGYTILVTAAVKPPPNEMKGIVESCGGTFLPQNRSSALPEKSFIISCQEDKSTWSKFKKSVPIVSAEIILVGVLQQKINVKEHTLK